MAGVALLNRFLPRVLRREAAEPPPSPPDGEIDEEELVAVATVVSWEGTVSTHKHQDCNTHITCNLEGGELGNTSCVLVIHTEER